LFLQHEVIMKASRRKFLQNSALIAIGCVANPLFPPAGHTQTSGSVENGTQTSMLPAPQRQAFVGAVGSSFQVSDGGLSQPVSLQLQAVNDPPAVVVVDTASMDVPPPANLTTTSTNGFVLTLGGGPVEGLKQGTYTFQSSSLGTFSMFIVPGGPQLYTAVFNQL
jgi:hypothetical protein